MKALKIQNFESVINFMIEGEQVLFALRDTVLTSDEVVQAVRAAKELCGGELTLTGFNHALASMYGSRIGKIRLLAVGMWTKRFDAIEFSGGEAPIHNSTNVSVRGAIGKASVFTVETYCDGDSKVSSWD